MEAKDGRGDGVDTLTGPTATASDLSATDTGRINLQRTLSRRLGASPLQLFPIALGSGSFGCTADERSSADIIDRFVGLGGNFIDATGPQTDGRGERSVGAWLASRRSRSSVLLGATAGHHPFDDGTVPVVTRSVESTLSRLGTDYLDLLAVRLDGRTPSDETLVAVDDLIRSGKVRFVAASSPSADTLIEARVVAAQYGISPLVAVQARYNLAERTPYEPDVARVVALQGCGFMPTQALASGLLAAAGNSRQEFDRTRREFGPGASPPKRWAAMMTALETVATEFGTTRATVALAWLLTRPNVVAPVVTASNPGQVAGIMAAPSVYLTRSQVAELDRNSR